VAVPLFYNSGGSRVVCSGCWGPPAFDVSLKIALECRHRKPPFIPSSAVSSPVNSREFSGPFAAARFSLCVSRGSHALAVYTFYSKLNLIGVFVPKCSQNFKRILLGPTLFFIQYSAYLSESLPIYDFPVLILLP